MMEFITTLMASLAVAAVFFRFGYVVGEKRGISDERYSWKEVLPVEIDRALLEACQRIDVILWHLRDVIHNLPEEGGSLPHEEARFLREVYCAIPNGIQSLVTNSVGSQFHFILNSESRDVLVKKYAGSMYSDDQELKASDFDRAYGGDYSAALLIVKAILSKYPLYKPATV